MKRLVITAAIAALFFAALAPARAKDDLLDIYTPYGADTQVPLNQPHRTLKELGDWLSETVSNALLFTPRGNREKLANLRPFFSEAGYKSYLAFLASYNLTDDMASESLNMATVVNNAPVLVGQGASSSRYAWAFELPVVMTILTPDTKASVNKSVTLRVQFGRAQGAPEPNGVLIENWQEFKQPAPQPKNGTKTTTTPAAPATTEDEPVLENSSGQP